MTLYQTFIMLQKRYWKNLSETSEIAVQKKYALKHSYEVNLST